MITHKEDIAKKYVPCRCDEIYTSRGLTAPDCPYHSTDPETAMDIWAKKQSIAFMQWNSLMYTVGIDRQADQWFDHKGECVAESTEELYGLFVASQNNPESFYYNGNQSTEQQNKEQ